ncbi:MAG: alpha-L-fucosidase [Thermofilaceae archaeon]
MEEKLRWFVEARFGMFIHWGLYSLLGRGEWVMFLEGIPREEYAKLAESFKAERFDAEEWALTAKEAGMRYIVLTARHHDGFSLFDTKLSDFKSTNTPAARDVVAEYVEACRKAGLKVGLYYSLLDWRWEEYWRGPQRDPQGWERFLEYVHGQVEELCSNYGRIDVLWFDGGWPYKPEDWRAQELLDKVRQLQPHILVNNRTGLPGDFDTPEQHVPWWSPPRRAWETCMTMNDSWGYFEADRNWKTPRQIISTLVQVVSLGGNLLLNVGPGGDGSFPPEAVEILSHVGSWLRRNGESIYGATGAPFTTTVGPTTMKGNKAYVHALRWPGSKITVANVGFRVLAARLLADGRELKFRQDGSRVFLEGLPPQPPDPYDTVIELEIELR